MRRSIVRLAVGMSFAFAAGTFPVSIVLDPSGQFAYVANDNSNDISVYAVNAGVLTPASHSPFAAGNQPHSIAID